MTLSISLTHECYTYFVDSKYHQRTLPQLLTSTTKTINKYIDHDLHNKLINLKTWE